MSSSERNKQRVLSMALKCYTNKHSNNENDHLQLIFFICDKGRKPLQSLRGFITLDLWKFVIL